MATPLVSVVMSVYNEKPFLCEAVESVLAQTFSDFEFIIVNDGSTDGSTDVLRQYARQDPRIRLFTQKNIGLTSSLNRGLRAARGKYVARIDGDDVCLRNRFALQVEHLDNHPRCVAVGGQAILIDEKGHPIRNSAQKPFSDGNGKMKGLWGNHAAIEEGLLDGAWPMLQSTAMIRREAIEAVGGYDERFETNQDHDLFAKLAEIGRLANLPETVVKYRRHRSQATAWSSGQDYAAIFRLKIIRREAYRRRALPLPRELRWASVIGTALRRGLSSTPLWPYVRKTWSMLR